MCVCVCSVWVHRRAFLLFSFYSLSARLLTETGPRLAVSNLQQHSCIQPFVADVMGPDGHTQLLLGCWGSKLWFLCLRSMHSYPLNHFPSLLYLFLIFGYQELWAQELNNFPVLYLVHISYKMCSADFQLYLELYKSGNISGLCHGDLLN